mmetsp:Transcript_28457/g.37888  ORF Transcript_28457/g.37888 Transcript_28457/m.37888 type:complete len:204 (-) Transcript_28457:2542-3153(-)
MLFTILVLDSSGMLSLDSLGASSGVVPSKSCAASCSIAEGDISSKAAHSFPVTAETAVDSSSSTATIGSSAPSPTGTSGVSVIAPSVALTSAVSGISSFGDCSVEILFDLFEMEPSILSKTSTVSDSSGKATSVSMISDVVESSVAAGLCCSTGSDTLSTSSFVIPSCASALSGFGVSSKAVSTALGPSSNTTTSGLDSSFET